MSNKYTVILQQAQSYITDNFGAQFTEANDDDKKKYYKKSIETFLFQYYKAELEKEGSELVNRLYEDMAGYGCLAPYLRNIDACPDVEEININRWNSIAVKHSDGSTEMLNDTFLSQKQSFDVIRRITNGKGHKIDEATPYVESYIRPNVRLTAYVPPIIPESYGICASIRFVHVGKSANYIYIPATLSKEMEDFLKACVLYKVPVLIGGEKGAGKTAFLNHLLTFVPDDKRIGIVEEGSPELGGLERFDSDGKLRNQVLSFMTRPSPSKHEEQNFDADKILTGLLRYDLDYIVPQEMRSREAYTAQEAAHTGSGVYATIHANSARLTWGRAAMLMKKAVDYSEDSLMRLSVEAFPIVVYMRKMSDGVRRVVEIAEGERFDRNRGVVARTLYKYNVTDNETMNNGKIKVIGSFVKQRGISENLQNLLLDHGAPERLIKVFSKDGDENGD
jgi:pilus assembly protein CpaF